MPLTREDINEILNGEGGVDEKASLILSRHNAELKLVQDADAQKERERADGLQAKLADARKELRELQKSAQAGGELEEAFKKSQETIESLQKELEASKVEGAIELALAASGLRNQKTAELVRRFIDPSQVKIDKDGSVTGAEEQIKALREDEQTAYLFAPETPVTPEYTPKRGDTPEGESYGVAFARRAVEAASPSLNATFDAAVI